MAYPLKNSESPYESLHSSRWLSRDDQQVSLLWHYIRNGQGYGWDGRTGTKNERCFVESRYTSRKGKVAPGNPEIEPELTPSRRVPLSTRSGPSHSPRSIPHSRPSLFANQPARHALAQNNRNCGEISVPHGSTIVAPREATRLLIEVERHCVSLSFRSFGSLSHHPGMVWLLRPFQSHCTLIPIARGTRCHDSIPWRIPRSFARSPARAIARGLLFTTHDESDVVHSVKCTRGQSSLVCARGGKAKPLAIDPGVLSLRTLGSNIRCWKCLFGSLGLRTDHSKLLRNWRIRDGICAICANMCFTRYASNETEMLTPSPIQFGRRTASLRMICSRYRLLWWKWNFGTSSSVLIHIENEIIQNYF